MKPDRETMDRTLALLVDVDWSAPPARRSRSNLRVNLIVGAVAIAIASVAAYWQYGRYVVRAEVTEAFALAKGMETALLAYMQSHGNELPVKVEDAQAVTGCIPPAAAVQDGTCAGESVAGCFPASVTGGTLRIDCRLRDTSAWAKTRPADVGGAVNPSPILTFSVPTTAERRGAAKSMTTETVETALTEVRDWLKGYWVGKTIPGQKGDEFYYLSYRCSESIRDKYLPDEC